MLKRLLPILLILMIIFTFIPAYAAEIPVKQEISNFTNENAIFKDTITVTSDGGQYQVGFVTLKFPKDFIESSRLPITFEVEISAVDGIAGIEINPSTGDFLKKVQVKVDSYNGLLYDKTSDENVQVHIKHQILNLKHFSRYAFS